MTNSETKTAHQVKRILVVEDDDSCQKVLSLILRRAGYRIVCVLDGYAALKHLRNTVGTCDTPDLILTDVCMPGCDGPTLMKELDRLGERIPVLVMTGDPEGHETAKLRRHGRHTIAKPFTQKEVLDSVSSAFAGEAKRDADAQKVHSMVSGHGTDLTLRPGAQP